MSFGLLKHFKDLKKTGAQIAPPLHVEHIILGHDLGAVLKLLELKKQHPEASVRLVSVRPITKDALLETYHYSVSPLRSQAAVEGIYKRYFNAKIFPQKAEPTFYKDGKFHDFGGRAKPMELQDGEIFFTQKGYKLDFASLFDPQDWENLDQILKDHQEVRIFEAVEKTAPSDLVDKANWLITFKDFARLTCENLYVSLSPKKFHQLLAHKEALTPELIDFCTSVKVQGAISVSWILDKEFVTEEKTLFIPQSMTHEWGHFIVEFEEYQYQSKSQLCHVLFLIHEEEPQSEDLAQKIKLMKRVLDRVFPDIEKHIKKEFIRFDEEMFISEVKDGALEQLGFDFPSLKFLGQVSAVPQDYSQEKYLSRSLLIQ